MPGLSLFHPPIQRTTKRPAVDVSGNIGTRLTWTPYDDRQLSTDTFHIFPRLPPELQMHVWRAAAESWIADRENQDGKQPCSLDNVVYAKPLRIRMKLPGLPGVFHACSLAREVTYDAFRDLCAAENLKRVGSGPKIERFRNECRKTDVLVGRESVRSLQKTDQLGGKSTIAVKTYSWMRSKDFRLEEKPRKKSTERVTSEKELPKEIETA